MIYREVKASERLPEKEGGRYSISVVVFFYIGGVEVAIYDYDENRWLKSSNGESIVVYKWLEPIEITEEGITEAAKKWEIEASAGMAAPYVNEDFIAGANWILSKFKGE